jgi:hypothetical protein
LSDAAAPILQPLIDRWGLVAVERIWQECHGCPVAWATDFRELLPVARQLELQGERKWS